MHINDFILTGHTCTGSRLAKESEGYSSTLLYIIHRHLLHHSIVHPSQAAGGNSIPETVPALRSHTRCHKLPH